jgi:hypothetical protein
LDEKEDILKKIGDITKILEKRWYSNEFLYREFYINDWSKLRGSEKPFTNFLSLATL